jgi:hypothetical protein
VIIKKINFEISIPTERLQKGKKYTIELKDDGTLIEALALVDKLEIENPEGSIFPINDGYIHSYLQLFINFEENAIYGDVGVSAYGPDDRGMMTKFNPIRDNIDFKLFPDSVIQLQPDVGC